jgi:hypothetical protein
VRQRRYFLLLRKPLAVQFAYDADTKQVLAHRIGGSCDSVSKQLLQQGDWLVRVGDVVSDEGTWSEALLDALLELLESDDDTKVILERPPTVQGARPAYLWYAAGRRGLCATREQRMHAEADAVLVHVQHTSSSHRQSRLQVGFCCPHSGEV